jgi:hypothetical protein
VTTLAQEHQCSQSGDSVYLVLEPALQNAIIERAIQPVKWHDHVCPETKCDWLACVFPMGSVGATASQSAGFTRPCHLTC